MFYLAPKHLLEFQIDEMYAFSAAAVNNNAQGLEAPFYPLRLCQHRDDGAAPLVFTNPVKRLPEDSLVNQRIVVSILALGCQV